MDAQSLPNRRRRFAHLIFRNTPRRPLNSYKKSPRVSPSNFTLYILSYCLQTTLKVSPDTGENLAHPNITFAISVVPFKLYQISTLASFLTQSDAMSLTPIYTNMIATYSFSINYIFFTMQTYQYDNIGQTQPSVRNHRSKKVKSKYSPH